MLGHQHWCKPNRYGGGAAIEGKKDGREQDREVEKSQSVAQNVQCLSICISGSYVMGFVLADTHDWLSSSSAAASDSAPFDIIPLQTFAKLREGVNDRSIDFFMWEHFTTKRYYDNGEVKRVGEIYTPWPSWHIVASNEVLEEQTRLETLLEKLNMGIEYFNTHHEETVEYISTELDYSAEDAKEWLGTVRFAADVKGVQANVVEDTVKVLKKAGVIGDVGVNDMIGIKRKE
jgi:hypothetical protein